MTFRLAKRYQSPLELRQRDRNNSSVSSISLTPIKASKDIVNSENVSTVNEIDKSANVNITSTKSTASKPNQKGRKRKASDPSNDDGNTTDKVSVDIEDIAQRPPKKLKF